jgi:hypothetical protein
MLVLQVHRCIRPRLRPILPARAALGTETELGYVLYLWRFQSSTGVVWGRHGLTDSRVLALSGQARHVHQVSISRASVLLGAIVLMKIASETRTTTWGACSAACASGSPRTW